MFDNLTLSRFGWNRKRRPRRAGSATTGRGFMGWRRTRSMRLESLEDRRLLTVEPVSAVFGGITGDGASFLDTASEYATSRDGRLVVFTSEATDFVAPGQDNNLGTDVFLYDRLDQSVRLISRADGTSQTANGASFSPMISDDGLFGAFLSTATDLVAGQSDINAGADLFLFEVAADTMSLISHTPGSATTTADGAVLAATMNFDGSAFAFDSLATNLVDFQDDLNGASDVFLSIITALAPSGETQLVSRAAGGGATETGGGASHGAITDAHGGFVLYDSEATNLVAGQQENNLGSDVFLFDERFQTTTLLSGSFGSQTDTANGISHAESMDFLGAFAVITSEADDLATVLDPLTDLLTPVTITDTNGGSDVYLFDANFLTMTLVSHAAGAPTQTADAASSSPTISADGRFIAFTTSASDVATGVTDAAGFEDVFLYDRISGSSELVSHAYSQPLIPANGDSTAPELNNDGRFVAFESQGTDLVGVTDPLGVVTLMTDTNGTSDIFVLDRGAGVMNLASHIEPALPTDPPTTGDGASTHPVISANGLSVAFNSDATDLFLFEGNAASDVFLFSTAAFGTNSAPVLDPLVSPELTPILEGTVADVVLGTPLGTAVDDLLATLGLYSDLDGTFSKGLAIVGQDETNGIWEFSSDGGINWLPFGITSDAFAILLSADGAGQNRIRFLPTDPQFFGTANFSFRGWDLTDGNLSGSIDMDVSLNGGNAAYSAETAIGVATVSAVNDQPFFIKGADQTVLEDSGPQSFVGWATGISAGVPNEAGQLLTFVLTPDDPALFAEGPAIDPVTGTLTFTPAPDAVGVATIDVQLVDDGGIDFGGIDTSITQTLVITITGVNDAPVPGPDVDVLENAGPQSVAGWIVPGGPDEAGQIVTIVSFSSTNPELFLDQPALAADGTLTFTPAPDAFGQATLLVVLQDNGGTANNGVDIAVSLRTLTITNVNNAPAFTLGADVTVLEDSAAYSAAWAAGISAGPNEGAQVLTFLVDSDHPEFFSDLPAIDPITGALSFTPAPDAFGTAIVTVQLVDDGGIDFGGVDASAVETFTITIDGALPAVKINQAAGQVGVVGEGPIHFTATFTDPVTDFDDLDLLLSGTASGPLAAIVTQVDADGMIYDVEVSGMTGRGSVIVDVVADAGVDRAGHLSGASTSTDNTVFFEPPQVSDNGDPSFAFKGRWQTHPGYRGTAMVSMNRNAGTTTTWTVPVAPGRYNILATWTAGRRHATNATYTVLDGGLPSAKVAVNQRRAPNDVAFDGAQWESLGTFNVFSDSLAVRLSAKANGLVDADAVRIVPVGDLAAPATQIIDDGALRFTTQGAWSTATNVGFQRDVRRSAKGSGTDTATWTFLVEPGEYQVAATWAAMPRLGATDTPFTITGATRFDARVNQRLAPNDFIDAGASWENLGTIAVTGHLLTVTLSDLANGIVAADAIRIQKVTPPGPAAVARSASVRSLDATMAALAATSTSPQASSPVFPLKSQRDAVDAIFAGPAGPALLM